MARPTLLYRAYVAATALLVPFAARAQISKLRAAGVGVARAHEKLGHATLERQGTGPLLWFHAASVGESLSVLSLITHISKCAPNCHFLITTGTATSADLVAKRLPPQSQHQFAPLDSKGPVMRFLAHWRPDAAIFVESELWPQMLRRTHARGIPMILLNARLSAKSQAGWSKRPKTARYILDVFDLIITQNDAMAHAMVALGAPSAKVAAGYNLKSLSGPLPANAKTVDDMANALGSRPLWVAASTHTGEEAQVIEAHQKLLKQYPDLCLILAPRHPDRAGEVIEIIANSGLTMTQRSAGEGPTREVYLADTLGELGVWYTMAPFVFLGGSLSPIGGHNPFEVAHAGGAIISGPHVTNFAETFTDMTAKGAVKIAQNAADIARYADHWLANADALEAAQSAARAFANDQDTRLDQLAKRVMDAARINHA